MTAEDVNPAKGGDRAGPGDYLVPPQLSAPPDAARAPLVPAPQRGGVTRLDRPPTVRRPVVAPPVRPIADPPAQPGWEPWSRGHPLRNALLVAAAILLAGSSLAAFIVYRYDDNGAKPNSAQPQGPIVGQPVETTRVSGSSTVPSIAPVTVPPSPASTSAPVPTVAPATSTTRPPTPTTRATVPATTVFTVTPVPGPTPTTKPKPTTTTSTTRKP